MDSAPLLIIFGGTAGLMVLGLALYLVYKNTRKIHKNANPSLDDFQISLVNQKSQRIPEPALSSIISKPKDAVRSSVITQTTVDISTLLQINPNHPVAIAMTKVILQQRSFSKFEQNPGDKIRGIVYIPVGIEIFLVIFPYASSRSDELSLALADRIMLRKVYEDGWCEGVRMENSGDGGSVGTVGIFPINCISGDPSNPSMDMVAKSVAEQSILKTSSFIPPPVLSTSLPHTFRLNIPQQLSETMYSNSFSQSHLVGSMQLPLSLSSALNQQPQYNASDRINSQIITLGSPVNSLGRNILLNETSHLESTSTINSMTLPISSSYQTPTNLYYSSKSNLQHEIMIGTPASDRTMNQYGSNLALNNPSFVVDGEVYNQSAGVHNDSGVFGPLPPLPNDAVETGHRPTSSLATLVNSNNGNGSRRPKDQLPPGKPQFQQPPVPSGILKKPDAVNQSYELANSSKPHRISPENKQPLHDQLERPRGRKRASKFVPLAPASSDSELDRGNYLPRSSSMDRPNKPIPDEVLLSALLENYALHQQQQQILQMQQSSSTRAKSRSKSPSKASVHPDKVQSKRKDTSQSAPGSSSAGSTDPNLKRIEEMMYKQFQEEAQRRIAQNLSRKANEFPSKLTPEERSEFPEFDDPSPTSYSSTYETSYEGPTKYLSSASKIEENRRMEELRKARQRAQQRSRSLSPTSHPYSMNNTEL
ncbi:hypothetical protein HK098_000490 [Nowakowskiella sp. JEL0407]|nr:hypothetical protein HK098_000490 [Nowakowskiella sp. JEL0407]